MRAVYAGSFDPLTNGHMWVINQASAMFDLTIAIANNPNKRSRIDMKDRIRMMDAVWPGKVWTIGNEYLAKWALENSIPILIRGIRSVQDFEYESAMRSINADIAPGVTTVFLIPPRQLQDISSSMVMRLVGINGWEDLVSRYVPPFVLAMLKGSK
jgi:pantetheine-phosphate adenylyltransferase